MSIRHLWGAYGLIAGRKKLMGAWAVNNPNSKFPLTSTDWLVLERMSLFASRDNGIYTRGFAILSDVLGCSTKTIQRSVTRLADIGFVVKVRSAGGPTEHNSERTTTSHWKLVYENAKIPDVFRMQKRDIPWSPPINEPEVRL